jgi:hypothetical protein
MQKSSDMEIQAGAPEPMSEKYKRKQRQYLGGPSIPVELFYLVEIEDLRAKGKAWDAAAPSPGLCNIPQYIPMPMPSPYTPLLMTS